MFFPNLPRTRISPRNSVRFVSSERKNSSTPSSASYVSFPPCENEKKRERRGRGNCVRTVKKTKNRHKNSQNYRERNIKRSRVYILSYLFRINQLYCITIAIFYKFHQFVVRWKYFVDDWLRAALAFKLLNET